MIDPISLIAAVAGVISAVRDGQELFGRWRRKRRQKREAAAGLDTALVGCPSCIQGEHDKFSSKIGPAFSRGDRVAIEGLTTVMRKFHLTFLAVLQHAISQNSIVNFSNLLAATHGLRDSTLDHLRGLFQRLQLQAPIPRDLPDLGKLTMRGGGSMSMLSLAETLPPYEPPAYVSPEIPAHVPMNTVPSLRTTLETVSRPVQEQYRYDNASRLRAGFGTMNLHIPTSNIQVDNLPSAALLQTHLARLRNPGR